MRPAPVTECFGPVIQGEGQLIGVQTHFVRFGGCDYRCTFCDSLHAVLPERIKANSTRMNEDEIISRLQGLGNHTEWVTLSGGNPVMHDLNDLVVKLKHLRYKIAVETQGSLFRDWLLKCDCVTVSPKGPSSGMPGTYEHLRLFMPYVQSHRERIGLNLKVVVFDERDYQFAKTIRSTYPNVPMTVQQGTDVSDMGTTVFNVRSQILNDYRLLLEKVCHDSDFKGVKVLPQLHAATYGHRLGV